MDATLEGVVVPEDDCGLDAMCGQCMPREIEGDNGKKAAEVDSQDIPDWVGYLQEKVL